MLETVVLYPGPTLRRVTSETATAQTGLARVIDPLPLGAGDVQLFATLDGPRGEGGGGAWLLCSLDGDDLAVLTGWGRMRALAGLPLEGALPGDAVLLLEEALAPWLDEAERSLDIAIRCRALVEAPPDLPVRSTLAVQGRGRDGGFVQARMPMRLSHAAAASLAAALAPRRAPRAEPRGLDLSLGVEIGGGALAAGRLRALQPGDAFALEEEDPPRIVLGPLAAPAERAGPGRYRLTAPLRRRADTQTETDPMTPTDQPDTPDPADLDAVDLHLTFRAGSATMELGRLRELAPGAIIETTEEAGVHVDILANGRVVGTGELIDVAGKRAVQIRTLFTGH